MPFSFSIQPVTENDIPAMTSIFTAAFANDANTQLKLVGKDPDSQANGMAMGIRQWLNYRERVTLLKAVETPTGTIIGWVGWARRGFEDQPIPSTTKEEDKRTEQPEPEHEKQDLDNAARLESLCNADMNRWISKIMPPGTRCRYLTSCLVDPSYQGRGVGNALIRWGTAKADQEGVLCWVHSSDGGEGFYEKMGFEEVERFVVQLDEFADGPRDGGGDWGEYLFRYMVRQPKDIREGV